MPAAASLVAGAFFTIVFSCWLMLRLIGSCLRQPLQKTTRIPDRELPVYTIIVALYREAETVEALVRSLRRLDYPLEKLDVKIAVEPDDHEGCAELSW